ncbi:MAG: hypothetical protein JWM19_2547 [Actinomycetia bacterium]|nr:hypothetical protein [Actinomycetes bacterium]
MTHDLHVKSRPVRTLADEYVDKLAALDPLMAAFLGIASSRDGLSDLSPDGRVALDELARSTLARLDQIETAPRPDGSAFPEETRCARLLRERLSTDLATSEGAEYLREIMNVSGLQQRIQGIFQLLPASTAEDWAVIARRMVHMPAALAGLRVSLREAARQGQFVATARQVRSITAQLRGWLTETDGTGWYAGFTSAASVPVSLQAELAAASASATAAVHDFRDWLCWDYTPLTTGVPESLGSDTYQRWVRSWNGATVELIEVYDWAWSEYRTISAQMRSESEKIRPGATALETMDYLDAHGDAVEGIDEIGAWLQEVTQQALADLDGTHFDIAAPLRTIEARVDPTGNGANPYYIRPSVDFARPGATWLPTGGRTRFPLWSLRSVWYHEGVPGHHLHLAQWVLLAPRLSRYQTSIGGVGACTEGWALYAERLMDELGYYPQPADRLGYLDWQLLRTVRVILDVGLHLRLRLPADAPIAAGEVWTPELASSFLKVSTRRSDHFIESEIGRYLGRPGQAISYKLGERAWLAGRKAARKAHAEQGKEFRLKAWHREALSLGSLGLDDLTDELSQL